MAERTFKFKFTGDADDLGRATSDAEGHVGGLGGKLASAGGKIVGAMAAVFAVDKLKDWGSALFDIGNQADVWGKKASIVFGDQLGVMEDWAAGVAGSMGMTKTELLGASAAMADLLIPMGFTREQAAGMTMDMSDLSGALSAWSGGTRTATEVNEILASALLGETDSLKGLGISIDAAEVSQRAQIIASEDGRAEITQMDEALATQQLIMEKSTDAQTAWADGTFDAQQKQAELSAKVKELKEKLATVLLPAFQSVTGYLVDDVIPAFSEFKEWVWPKIQAAHDSLIGWWNTNGPAIVRFIVGVKEKALEMGQGFVDAWNDKIKPAIDDLKEALAQVGSSTTELKNSTASDTNSMSTNWYRLGQVAGASVAFQITQWAALASAISYIEGRISQVVGQVRWMADQMSIYWGRIKADAFSLWSGITWAFDGIKREIDNVRSAVQWLKDTFDRMRSALAVRISIPTPNWPKPPSWMSNLSPFFHSGTMSVPGAPGANVPAVLQAGETVLSRGQTRRSERAGGAGGGMTLVVNAYGATGREMIAEIERAVRDGARSAWLTSAGIG